LWLPGYLLKSLVLKDKLIIIKKKKINMKNLFKFGFFALAISLSVVACNSNKATDASADSASVDSITVDTAAVDTVAADSSVVAVDTTAAQ
jgi:hypothetical protein